MRPLLLLAAASFAASVPHASGVGGDDACESQDSCDNPALLQLDVSARKLQTLQRAPPTPDVMPIATPVVKKLLGSVRDFDLTQAPAQPDSRHLPVCDIVFVLEACLRMTQGKSATTVSRERLADMLSSSEAEVSTVWSALKLDTSEQDVQCRALCGAIVDYVGQVGAALPPMSNLACYTLRGETKCDVDVSLAALVGHVSRMDQRHRPDDGPSMVNETTGQPVGLVQHGIMAVPGGLRSTQVSSTRADTQLALTATSTSRHGSSVSPYTLWTSIERLANEFRLFPSSGKDLPISLPATSMLQDAKVAATEVETAIAVNDARAQAWMSTVLSEMMNLRTASDRSEWFGGPGSMSESEVRTRIFRTMNFVDRELMDGVRYVYPADQALSTACTGTVIAYVWTFVTSETGFAESRGPRCRDSDDPFTENCGIDTEGRYYVYLCETWFNDINDDFKIATMVHEAVHHAGPSDVTYNLDAMRRLPQAQQLDNAANYQNFAQDVVQSARVCTDDNDSCRYWASQDFCATYRQFMEQNCRLSCGICGSPAPAPTPAPTPEPSCSDLDGFCASWADEGFCVSATYRPYMEENCRLSCNLCGSPSCFDLDSSCGYWGSQGYCTDSSYATYMQANCRDTCGLC